MRKITKSIVFSFFFFFSRFYTQFSILNIYLVAAGAGAAAGAVAVAAAAFFICRISFCISSLFFFPLW